jgi:GxxExxY protein
LLAGGGDFGAEAAPRRGMMLLEEAVTGEIIGAAMEVHEALGPGLLESAYEECLCHELLLRGIPFRRQVEIPVEYKGIKLACGYRMDVLVRDAVVVEVKAIQQLLPVHEAQLLTYLRLSAHRVGLLLNFNVNKLRAGILRKVL